ncbi:hypothetical protein HPB49_015367 [Dermacentor silvarum]|uniref:Uncharacterized protein n=1 Tax=Dermacentor silvarum TaxID=543639 RepID=A0ACB8CS10_DERSI|nr:hypothetical protein HPB49_015367 [Dermacentor silvarum]
MDTNDAKEIGNLGVDLDGARGVFTGTLIDYRMPCTASEDTTCQIVSNLSVWNELLCWIHLELRELPETGRQIGLVRVREKWFRLATEYHLRRAAAVLYWLLKTHRCVASVHIPYLNTSSGERCKFYRAVFEKLLDGNSIKSLTVECSLGVDSTSVYNVILSLKCLEEFESWDPWSGSLVSTAICALIPTTTTLTVLHLSKYLHLDGIQAQTLFAALRANTTLKDLSLGGAAIRGDPASFVQFLASNATLQRLVLGDISCRLDNTLKCIFEGMLKNGSVWSLEVDNFILDSESVELGARMLRESKVLRCFKFSTRASTHDDHMMTDRCRQEIPGNIGTWHEAVSQSNTLQYMTLSFGIWNAEHWGSFFRILSKHKSLKMVTIDVREIEYAHLAGVVRELELSGSEEKVSFNAPCRIDTLALSDCKRCSELAAYVPIKSEPNFLRVFEQLPALSHLNALSLTIEHWDITICSLVAQYIATTSVLRKLHIQLNLESYPRESVQWFPALSQSLLLNRSITELGIGARVHPSEALAIVGEAVRRRATIRTICILEWSAPALLSFMCGLSAGIAKNRTLCHTASGYYYEWAHNVKGWFAVYHTARRNSGFVARAAQFLNHARCDRHCAAGLDRVSRHPALLAELAEVLSIGQVEAADMVQRRFRSIEGLHEFMRLAGVVKGRVTCLPREDGRTQLDDLTYDCWAHVRRYLELDDVPHSSASPSSP